MKRLIQKFKNVVTRSKALVATIIGAVTVSVSTVLTHATGTSMLDASVTSTLDQFVLDGKATVLALIGILVPAGLSIWAIGFGIKKGIGFLQRKLKKAV